MDNKQEMLQKVLSDLYHVFRYENCQRMDQALYTVLEAMEKHPGQKHIQISGRYACVHVYCTYECALLFITCLLIVAKKR